MSERGRCARVGEGEVNASRKVCKHSIAARQTASQQAHDINTIVGIRTREDVSQKGDERLDYILLARFRATCFEDAHSMCKQQGHIVLSISHNLQCSSR